MCFNTAESTGASTFLSEIQQRIICANQPNMHCLDIEASQNNCNCNLNSCCVHTQIFLLSQQSSVPVTRDGYFAEAENDLACFVGVFLIKDHGQR